MEDYWKQFPRKKLNWRKSKKKAKILRKLSITRQSMSNFLKKITKLKHTNTSNIQEKSKNSTNPTTNFSTKAAYLQLGDKIPSFFQKRQKQKANLQEIQSNPNQRNNNRSNEEFEGIHGRYEKRRGIFVAI